MKRYIIEKYKRYSSVQLYSVRYDDQEENETDRFISRFTKQEDHAEDFYTIISWINKIGETGVLERYFRREGRASAIPIISGVNLRLYCYRVNDHILILGNGGIKTSQKVKDSPECFPHFFLMNHVAKRIHWALEDNRLMIKSTELIGKLHFNLPKP